MKLTKSLKITFLAILAVVVSILGVMMMESRYVSATVDTFQMVSGAEARIVGSNTENYGIRFKANIHKDDEDLKETDRFFVMIIPSGWIDTYGLTNGCDYYKILVEDNGKVAEGENRTINIMESLPELVGDYYEIKGSITNVKYANSFRDFFGIVYKTDADGVSNRKYAKFVDGENERNISQVVSAELNVGGHLKEQTDYMLDMVKNAYNAQKGNATATEDLPAISAESVALAIEKDKTYQLKAPVGIPENIDIEVKWTTSDENSATVENGLVTVKSDNANADIKVKVLGTEYQMASVIEDSVYLNGYDTEESIARLWNANQHASDYKDNPDLVAQNKWHETVDDKVGVAAVNGYGSVYDFRFNSTIEELKNIGLDDDDIISITYKYTANFTYGIATKIFGVTTSYSYPDTWYTRDFTVAQIAAANTDLDTFFSEAGSDSVKQKGARIEMSISKSGTLYVDSVRITKVDADYVTPDLGEEFSLPMAKLIGARGAILAYSNQATVTHNGSPITVENGKFIAEMGNYNINYAMTYGGKDYAKSISFTVARTMAENMLEDFDSQESVSNLWNTSTLINQEQKDQNKWHESYTDDNSVTKTGVVSVNCIESASNKMFVRFNRTAEELKALGLDENDTICLTMMWTRTTGTYITGISIFGVSLASNHLKGVWHTVEISVADIIAANTDLDTFFGKAGSDGTGVNICNGIGSGSTLYLAEISFTKNA